MKLETTSVAQRSQVASESEPLLRGTCALDLLGCLTRSVASWDPWKGGGWRRGAAGPALTSRQLSGGLAASLRLETVSLLHSRRRRSACSARAISTGPILGAALEWEVRPGSGLSGVFFVVHPTREISSAATRVCLDCCMRHDGRMPATPCSRRPSPCALWRAPSSRVLSHTPES